MLCLASILLSHPYVVCVYGRIAVTTGLSLVFMVRGVGFIARHNAGGISIFFENSGEENQFLGEGILVTESLGSVYKGRED